MLKNISNKKKITVAILVILAISIGALYGVVKNTPEARGENPISSINKNRSQVLVSGEKYSLNKDQEKEYKKQQKQQQKQIEKKEKEKRNQFENRIEQEIEKEKPSKQNKPSDGKDGPTSPGKPTNPDGQISPDGPDGPTEPTDPVEPEKPTDPVVPENPGDDDQNSKLPTIVTNLKDGETIAGLKLSFELSAKDYKGYKIEAFNFTVRVNGEKISSSGSNNYERKYKWDVNEGENKVTITVKDSEDNTITKNYTIYADPNGEKEVIGQVRVTIEAKTIGKGTIVETGMTVDIYKDESIAEVTKRVLDSKGISYTMKSSGYTGAYLSRIYKNGITNGYAIPKKLKDKLDAEGATIMKHKEDSLGEFDFYKDSGWICILNGEYLETGTSNIDLNDGDEIRWGFTTSLGREYISVNAGGWREEVDIW